MVTVEENVLQGGFGSAVLELLQEEGLAPRTLRIGLPDAFIEQGSQKELRAAHGLDAGGSPRRYGDSSVFRPRGTRRYGSSLRLNRGNSSLQVFALKNQEKHLSPARFRSLECAEPAEKTRFSPFSAFLRL